MSEAIEGAGMGEYKNNVIPETIKKQVNDQSAVVVISAIGKNESIASEVAVKARIDEKDVLHYYELLESSRMQKNLVYSLWFDHPVTILILTEEQQFSLHGKIYKALMAGYEFEREYEDILAEVDEDADLSTVWEIEIKEVEEVSYPAGRRREKQEHPYLMHMDHIYINPEQ